MECRDLTAMAVNGLLGQTDETRRRELASHLAECPVCRAEMAKIERTWAALGEDPDVTVRPDFRRRTLALLEEEMIRNRIRTFRPRARWPLLAAQAAALAFAALGGYWVALRGVASSPPSTLVAKKEVAPALEPDATLANISYRPADAQGEIGIAFDVTRRQTVVGRPEDPAIAKLLAQLVSRSTQTAGERSRAIELVSSHYGAGVTPASPDIVAALTNTLKRDQNPGVRKKAADALAGFKITPEIRAAFLEALRSDRNPAVRLVAVEVLAASAKETPDPRTIDSLREKAYDPTENGFVRAKAASALKAIEF